MSAKPKVVAIIQARMGSTRLPEKVMRQVAGLPMIHHVVERCRRIEGVDQVVMATSSRPRERPLVDYVEAMAGVDVFRGPEADVLARFYGAASQFEAQVVMRITGDCPLLSPRVSSEVLQTYLERRERCDYVTNTLERTYPRGLDTSVMSFEALHRAHEEAVFVEEREHVTPYIWSNPSRFEVVGHRDPQDHHHHRWTVDTSQDLRLVRRIYSALYPNNPQFEYEDVLALIAANPHWSRLNGDVEQKSIWR